MAPANRQGERVGPPPSLTSEPNAGAILMFTAVTVTHSQKMAGI